MLRKAIFLVALALPLAAWAFVKPVRVLAPQLEGLECEGLVCVDDPARRAEATALYRGAVRFVQMSVGAMQTEPRAIFCSTHACSEKFGLGRRNAYNVGTGALVIGDRGWYPFFVRHELIHHLQNERLGSLRNRFFKPTWFREGMAYSLSEDPRRPLPEPLQGYRSQFEAWYGPIGLAQLWGEAEKL
jgi:hypothetical protein